MKSKGQKLYRVNEVQSEEVLNYDSVHVLVQAVSQLISPLWESGTQHQHYPFLEPKDLLCSNTKSAWTSACPHMCVWGKHLWEAHTSNTAWSIPSNSGVREARRWETHAEKDQVWSTQGETKKSIKWKILWMVTTTSNFGSICYHALLECETNTILTRYSWYLLQVCYSTFRSNKLF